LFKLKIPIPKSKIITKFKFLNSKLLDFVFKIFEFILDFML